MENPPSKTFCTTSTLSTPQSNFNMKNPTNPSSSLTQLSTSPHNDPSKPPSTSNQPTKAYYCTPLPITHPRARWEQYTARSSNTDVLPRTTTNFCNTYDAYTKYCWHEGTNTQQSKTPSTKLSPLHKKNSYTKKNKPAHKKKVLPFVIPYHPYKPNITCLLHKNWQLIEKDPVLSQTFPEKPITAFTRQTNLRDLLVRNHFSGPKPPPLPLPNPNNHD